MSEKQIDTYDENASSSNWESRANDVKNIPSDTREILFIGWYIKPFDYYKSKEEKVKEIILSRTLDKSIKEWHYEWWIDVKYIWEGLYLVKSIKKWNITFYSDKDWKPVFSISWIRTDSFIKNWKALEDLGYIEKKEGDTYNMYKIDWYKEWIDWKKEPILWEQIKIDNIQYYKIWKNILFQSDIYSKFFLLKDWKPIERKLLTYFIEWWSFKFEDLEIFRQKWLITPEDFNYWIQEMKKVLVSQCGDSRLINLKWLDWKTSWIKESDLKKYMEKKEYWISPELALECYKVLPKEMRDLSNKND